MTTRMLDEKPGRSGWSRTFLRATGGLMVAITLIVILLTIAFGESGLARSTEWLDQWAWYFAAARAGALAVAWWQWPRLWSLWAARNPDWSTERAQSIHALGHRILPAMLAFDVVVVNAPQWSRLWMG